ncbi:MAG: NUDIX hydrolase [Candidatus Bathyarchaeota archaeon]|nr:NUDIX hydrolase [Candidatus Bathyarchaeota archaeon]
MATSKKRPILAVDAVVRFKDGFVFVKRGKDPYKGWWALPGGVVEYGETVEEAVKREVKEETGLDVKIVKLLGVYSKPDRDPRGHYISIVYLVEAVSGRIKASSDAEDVKIFYNKPEKLAFDHDKIFEDAVGKLECF